MRSGQLGNGENENLNSPTLLMKDENILILMSGEIKTEWNPENHVHFPLEFKQIILTFILFLRRNHQQTNLKIPKFLLFEITKLTIKTITILVCLFNC